MAEVLAHRKGPSPGTGKENAPPEDGCVHPPGPDCRLGTELVCAAAGAASANAPPTTSRSLDANLAIVPSLAGIA